VWTDNTGVKIIRIRGKKRVKKVGFSTVDEILDDILNTLPLEFQEKIKEMTADEFCISQRSNLGMTIKSKYFYRNKERERLITSLSNKKEYTFLDGDVFSRIVLEKLYERITTMK
jgi:RecG-like helicase